MKKLFSSFSCIIAIILWGISATSAMEINKLPEVSCVRYGLSADQQCFEGERIYLKNGIEEIRDTMTNRWKENIYFFQKNPWTDEKGFEVTFDPLQWTTWAVPRTMQIDFNTQDWINYNINGVKHLGIKIEPGETKSILRNGDSSPLVFVGLGNQQLNREQPFLKMTIKTNDHGTFWHNNTPYPNRKKIHTHYENVFYYGAWCGDGVVDTRFGEKYDDGANNGKPGFATTDCQSKPPVPPPPTHGICDGASNGIPTETPPTRLCQSGTPSVVVDAGNKFTWTCGGVNGGNNKTCEAPKKSKTTSTASYLTCRKMWSNICYEIAI